MHNAYKSYCVIWFMMTDTKYEPTDEELDRFYESNIKFQTSLLVQSQLFIEEMNVLERIIKSSYAVKDVRNRAKKILALMQHNALEEIEIRSVQVKR